MNEIQLSDLQWKMIRYLSREILTSRQIAGYGAAPRISACRALVRRGLAYTYRTGHFGLTTEGKALIGEAMKRMPPKQEPSA